MGTFRDDHDAALHRVTALEAELERARADDSERDRKLAELESELSKERAKLKETEAELAKHRPPTAPISPTTDLGDTTAAPGSNQRRTIAVALAIVSLIVFIAWCAGKADEREVERIAPPPSPPFLPDEISALMPELRARAHRDDQLLSIEAKGVTKDGALHATYGELEATFFRHEPAAPTTVDPSIPVGAAPPVQPSFDEYQCTYVKRTATGWVEHPLAKLRICPPLENFKHAGNLEPRCSMKSIWVRAIADGAPPDAIASLRLHSASGWSFEIVDQRLNFEKRYWDDC